MVHHDVCMPRCAVLLQRRLAVCNSKRPINGHVCCLCAAGANAGLGFQTSLAIAKAGGHVVLAVRNPQKGEE